MFSTSIISACAFLYLCVLLANRVPLYCFRIRNIRKEYKGKSGKVEALKGKETYFILFIWLNYERLNLGNTQQENVNISARQKQEQKTKGESKRKKQEYKWPNRLDTNSISEFIVKSFQIVRGFTDLQRYHQTVKNMSLFCFSLWLP